MIFNRLQFSSLFLWSVLLLVLLLADMYTCKPVSIEELVSADGEWVSLARSFERDQTLYDWTHYISLIERKPGALRNGAPFKTMPEPFQELRPARSHPLDELDRAKQNLGFRISDFG